MKGIKMPPNQVKRDVDVNNVFVCSFSWILNFVTQHKRVKWISPSRTLYPPHNSHYKQNHRIAFPHSVINNLIYTTAHY